MFRKKVKRQTHTTGQPTDVVVHFAAFACFDSLLEDRDGREAGKKCATGFGHQMQAGCIVSFLFFFFYSEGPLHAFEGKPQTGFKLQTKVTCTECRWVVFHAVRRLKKASHLRLLRQPWLIIFMRVLIWKHTRRP